MSAKQTPLAIVGIGCLFPKASSLQEFWANIKDRVDGITEVPATHWSPEDYFDADPKKPDMTYARRGGFLSPVPFDAAEFGISPNTLEATDAAQLMGLVAAQMALRDAGYGPEKEYDRNQVSVILGVTGTLELVVPLGARLGHPIWRKALAEHGITGPAAEAIVERIKDGYVPWQENSFPGLLGNVVAGRIANRFNFGGTNCVVDAACGSSLSAAHLASLELHSGRSRMVVTGGVDCFNDIFMYMCFSKTPALSATGDAKPFDKKADGTILGEGIGMVVLKRLEDAEKDGDRIYAVLKGVGSSSDGRGKSIYAPSAEGQQKALRKAYEVSGVDPKTVGLVEAHGTGTTVGDGVEVDGLKAVYGEAEEPYCALGSIKSMIGHTKAAAGSAGMIKAALALRHKVLPPTIKVTDPIPQLDKSPFYLSLEKRPWLRRGAPRRAAVSALGFGGANFHAVLEEHRAEKDLVDWDGAHQLVALNDESALAAWEKPLSWDEVRVLAARARAAFDPKAEKRLAFVVSKGEDLPKLIGSIRQGLAKGQLPPGAYLGSGRPGKLAVLFSGQGSQYCGMGRDLACLFPEAFSAVEEAEAALGLRLGDLMYPRPTLKKEEKESQEKALRATECAQPALGAAGLGAWRALRAFGLRADAFAGHSYGELPALCAAGVYGPEELFRLSRRRGELMAAGDGGRGGMVAVQAALPDIEKVMAEEKLDLVVANKNAPSQTVLSGRKEEAQRAAEVFGKRGLRAVTLPVAAAFHSPLVAAAEGEFYKTLEACEFRAPEVPVYANKTAQPYPKAEGEMRALLASQLASPVEFVRMVERMAEDGVTTFVEVGAGARLAGLVGQILPGKAAAVAVDASGGKKAGAADLARALAQLAALGYPLELSKWEGGEEAVKSLERKPGKMSVALTGANHRSTKPKAQPKPELVRQSLGVAAPAPQASMRTPVAPAAVADGSAVMIALQATQSSLEALQRLQEQTAQLHTKFLEAQGLAQASFQSLVEQQQRLMSQMTGVPLPQGLSALPAPVMPLNAPALQAPQAPARSANLPVVQPAPQAPERKQAAGLNVEKVLLAVVSEKTGYPPEMLNLDMDLESDLGIDSIKRVEIMSAMTEKLPGAPKVKPEHLGTLRTLKQIIAFLSEGMASAPVAAATVHVNSSVDSSAVQGTLLQVVSEKTGYPPEMLNLDMDLESDLGIDSIKRVEIMSAMTEKLPGAPKVKPEHLGTLRTLRQIIGFLAEGGAEKGALQPQAEAQPAPQAPEKNSEVPPLPLLRQVLRAFPVADGRKPLSLDPSKPVWVTDGSDLSQLLCERLESRGLKTKLVSLDAVPAPGEPVGGLIIVGEPRLLAPGKLWPERSEKQMKAALMLAQRCAPFLQSGALFATVSRLDGSFGLLGLTLEQDPVYGALAGLSKTAAREWTSAHCKAVDLACDWEGADAAEALAAELLLEGPVEVGLSSAGARTLVLEEVPQEGTGSLPLSAGDVVLVTGGARGVTVEACAALAPAKPTLVLLGRTPPPAAEEPWVAACRTEAELKRAIAERMGASASPRVVGAKAAEALAAREVRAQLARLERLGAKVVYKACDVREGKEVSALLASVRKEHGPVRGLVHGAGVLADKKIADKTADGVVAVLGTKLGGLRHLLSALEPAELRFAALFSSTTARFGRVGQVDYAMANEALNKAARLLARRLPECRVVSFGWGPWDGGMVTPSIKGLFASEGIGLIGLEQGGRFLADELRGHSRAVEVVALGRAAGAAAAPSGLSAVFERKVSLDELPVLRSHVIAGRAVLPTALMVEWLAHAALHGNPGLRFHGLKDLRVYKGVRVREGESYLVAAFSGKAAKRDKLFAVRAELRGPGGVLHAGAEVLLSSSAAPAPAAEPAPSLPAYKKSLDRAYSEVLFHGPELRAIRAVSGCSERGIVADAAGSPSPSSWMRSPLRDHWLADPMALDAAFQAMILWSRETRGAPNLPSALGSYTQYGRFPSGGCRVVCRVAKSSEGHAAADIDLLDAHGALVARLEGFECTIEASLGEAFRRNAVEVVS